MGRLDNECVTGDDDEVTKKPRKVEDSIVELSNAHKGHRSQGIMDYQCHISLTVREFSNTLGRV